MVHISPAVDGFFLSETALRQLHVLSEEFPNPPANSDAGAIQQSDDCIDGKPCIARTTTPDRPTQIEVERMASSRVCIQLVQQMHPPASPGNEWCPDENN